MRNEPKVIRMSDEHVLNRRRWKPINENEKEETLIARISI